MKKALFYLSVILFFSSIIFVCLNPTIFQGLRNQLYDSDNLFPFALYNGILNSGNLDWMFSGVVPYFPDLIFGFIIWLLFRDIHLTLAIYAVLQAAFLTFGMLFLSKCLFGKNYVFYSLIMIFSSIPILLLALGEILFFYIFSWYKHVSVVCLIFIALGLLVQIIDNSSKSKKLPWQKLIILDILTFIAVASDALFIIQFIAPAIITLVIFSLLSIIHYRKMMIIVASFLLSVVIGQSLYDLPNLWGSERIGLLDAYLKFSPERFILNWNTFYKNFMGLLENHYLSIGIWMFFYLTCFVIAYFIVRLLQSSKAGLIRKRALIVLLFFFFQAPAIISALVISGSTEFWYFHPIIYIPLFGGWPFIAGFLPGLYKFIRQKVVIAVGFAVIAVTITFLSINSFSRSAFPNITDYYPSLVACVDQKVGNLGLTRGIAQYWQARPITLLSKNEIVVVQVNPDLSPFHWENNSDYYKDDFEFIIVDQPVSTSFSIDKATVIDRFGEPVTVISCDQNEILIYNRPQDKLFRHQFDNTAIVSDK